MYESAFDPEQSLGWEVKVARASGVTDALAIIDHSEGAMVEAPLDVGLLMAQAIVSAMDMPPRPPAGEWIEQNLLDTNETDVLDDGFTLCCVRNPAGEIISFLVGADGTPDAVDGDDLTLPAAEALDMARQLLAQGRISREHLH